MKKIFALLLCICMFFGMVTHADAASGVAVKQYELWTQSPSISCGLTTDDAIIYKAIEKNLLELYPLSKVGENYYLAIASDKRTDGGSTNNKKTTQFYFYTLLETDNGFIILSKDSASNEYYWDGGYCFADISSQVDSTYYINNGSEVPYYILNPKSKYTISDYTEYDEYFIITNLGKIYGMKEDAEYGAEGYPYIKDKILYRGQNRYRRNSSSYLYYVMSDGSTRASNSAPMYFKNGEIICGTTKTMVAVDSMTSDNGYTMYTEGFASNIAIPRYYQIPGSDNLFFTVGTTRTLDTTSNTYYYYLNLEIYKSGNGEMTKIKTQTIPTRYTSSTVTPQKIEGIDETYYTSKGLLVPAVAFGYYAVITRDGTICSLNLDRSKYYTQVYPCTYNGHYAVIRSYNGSNYIYKQESPNSSYYYWQVINEITFDATGAVTVGADEELKIQSTAHAGQNGFFSKYNTFNASNFTAVSVGSVKSWWGRSLTNYFPDGRYVSSSWTDMGNGLYELWYNIYNADGTLRATGPTGYSGYFGSVFSAYDLIAWAVNDSKFIVCLGDLGRPFLKEYYRVAVVEETDTGEVVSKVELGEKNITPPSTSDTEVVQNKINFGATDLPLGYNIKNNVIDSNKLDAMLRSQVNSIRLNDIVILKKAGYQSGEQNTGVTLSDYSSYDYSFGSSYVRLYTNGQYFRWYCYGPENLSPGTYYKMLEIGDKTIYVTFEIVDPPSNEGSTTVVF